MKVVSFFNLIVKIQCVYLHFGCIVSGFISTYTRFSLRNYTIDYSYLIRSKKNTIYEYILDFSPSLSFKPLNSTIPSMLQIHDDKWFRFYRMIGSLVSRKVRHWSFLNKICHEVSSYLICCRHPLSQWRCQMCIYFSLFLHTTHIW